MAPRGRFRRSGPTRIWTGTGASVYTTVLAATKVLLGSFTSTANIDETVLRCVGAFAVKSDQDAASEDQLGAFGLCVVTDRAVAIGFTAVPGPVTNIADDVWSTYMTIAQSFEFQSAVGVNPDMAQLYHFDSRAKRKIPDGYSLAVMVENAHATHGFEIALTVRVLSMIPGT